MRPLSISLADDRVPCVVLIFDSPSNPNVPTPLLARATGNTYLEASCHVIDVAFAFSSFNAFGKIGCILSGAPSANDVSGVYAVCFFKSLAFPKEENANSYLSRPDLGAPMVISTTILSVSYITRVVKMHDTASQWVIRRTRIFFGNRCKSMLKFMRNRAQLSTVKRNERTTSSLKVGLKVGLCWIVFSVLVIGYRLALTVFLTIRAVLDLCDSMLWEVSGREVLVLVSQLTRVLHKYCGSFSELSGPQSSCCQPLQRLPPGILVDLWSSLTSSLAGIALDQHMGACLRYVMSLRRLLQEILIFFWPARRLA